jgi:hypothetical protein
LRQLVWIKALRSQKVLKLFLPLSFCFSPLLFQLHPLLCGGGTFF